MDRVLNRDQVIQCVKKYPVLYDLNSQRSSQRRQAWVEVAKELNHDVISVQKKWKNIKDEYVKVKKRISKDQLLGPEYLSQMNFMKPYLPSLSSKSSIKGKKRKINYHEETESDDDEYDSTTRSPASLNCLDKMNGLDLILLGVSKLMKTYPQKLSEAQSSMDEVAQICLLISKVIKKFAQSEPHLANPSISKFLMEQLANNSTSNQTEDKVRVRPSRLPQLTLRKDLW